MDSVRGIAILLVVFNHTSALLGGWTAPVWGRMALYADTGVLVFFVLSGFLLYRPFAVAHAGIRDAPRIRDYFRRRVLRIVPAYWLALTLIALWPGISGPLSKDWWRYYFFLQSYSEKTVNLGITSAWSLCVEVTFYIVLPMLSALVAVVIARRARGPWWHAELAAIGAFAAAGVVSAALISHFQLAQPLYEHTLLTTCQVFALGMALAVLSVASEERGCGPLVRWAKDHPGFVWFLAACAFAMAIYAFEFRIRHASTGEFVANRIALSLAAGLLVVPAALGSRGLVGRLLASKLLSWIGLISYGIFLWHFALAAWLADYRLPGDDGPGLRVFHHVAHLRMFTFFLTVMIVSCAVASASYYGFELPFLRLKERRLFFWPKRTDPEAAVKHP